MSLFACVWFGYHLRLGEDPESYQLYTNARRLMGSTEKVRNLGDQEAALRDFAHKNGLVVQYLWGQGFTLSIAGTGRITYDQPITLGDYGARRDTRKQDVRRLDRHLTHTTAV